MEHICIFAGTTEGRDLAIYLAQFSVQVTACVATEYGETLLPDMEHLTIHTGRMTQPEMTAFFQSAHFALVVDCTHPYAQVVTENIAAACADVGVEYVRVLRQGTADDTACTTVANTAAAVEYLKTTQGNILSTIGSKELGLFAKCGYADRLYPRVLPFESALQACAVAQIPPAHIIAMQGPFSYELNRAMITAFDIKILLSKDGGTAGGFAEKMQIAQDMGLELVLIQKPKQREGISLDEAKMCLALRYNLRDGVQNVSEIDDATTQKALSQYDADVATATAQTVTLVACGVGDATMMTAEASVAIAHADALIGAKRLTDTFAQAGQVVCNAVLSDAIAQWVAEHKQHQTIAVLLTGDIGFYSGAKKLYNALQQVGIPRCETICGISSPIYLCSKLRTPWEDATLISLHGRGANLIATVNRDKKVFALLDGTHNAQTICQLLCDYDMGDVTVSVGENLSYENERITTGRASELTAQTFATLSCMLICNEHADATPRFGIEDDAFVRVPKVPMTKAEVRAVSLSKLQLPPDAVVYDVGAGTGSVSIEMALAAWQGKVYAIEKNKDALVAIAQNKRKFKTEHLSIVEGLAPDCMTDLPAPTHVFIGGSSGNLAEIVALCLAKNPNTRFVVNTVTLETLTEAVTVSKQFASSHIVELASAQSKALGRYHLMMANNPIYIITFQNME